MWHSVYIIKLFILFDRNWNQPQKTDKKEIVKQGTQKEAVRSCGWKRR